MRTVLSIAAIALVAGCNNSGEAGADNADAVSTVSAEQRFHPLEQYCVEYEHSGSLSGTSRQCSRKWGAESYTVENLSISASGISQAQNRHQITIGKMMYSINPETLEGTRSENPFYDDFIEAGPEKVSAAIMGTLGLEDTGENKQVAGYDCDIMSSAQMGTACFTKDMVMLERDVLGLRQVATSVDLANGGPDEDYTLYERSEITEGPDIGQIMGNK